MDSFPGAPKRACQQCRRRKVRCNGGPSECEPCQRLGFDCSFVLGQLKDVPIARLQKIRGSTACLYCRRQKIRCSNSFPQCTNCTRKSRICTYPTRGRTTEVTSSIDHFQATQQASPDGTLSQRTSLDLDAPSPYADPSETLTSVNPVRPEPQALELIEMFFEHIYPVPSFSFLHPASIKEKAGNGTLDHVLGHAICAITDLLLFRCTNTEEKRTQWISEVEHGIWDELERPTLFRLQALILCVAYHMENGHFQRAFMLAGLAARAATAIRLNHEAQSNDMALCESRRRTLWSLKLLEQYFSVGLPENELLPFESVFLQFPIPEEDFQMGRLSANFENGLCSLFIRLTSIRRDIMKLNRSIALCDQPFPELLKMIRSLSRELEHLGTKVNEHDFTPETIGSTSWLARRTATRLSWHQCHCDLYRLLLLGYPEAAPAPVLEGLELETTNYAVQCCLTHSLAAIQTLSDANTYCAQTRLMEFDACICGYHAAKLLLFLSQSGHCSTQLSPEYAISRAELCLASLKRFFRFSPLATPVIRELEEIIGGFASRLTGKVPISGRTVSLLDAQEPQPSAGLRVRQRLAIHSLLRQADFDEDISEADTSPLSSASMWSRSHFVQQVEAFPPKDSSDITPPGVYNGQSHSIDSLPA